ncbi:MAG: hypothetical protein DHS20C01_03210 [marine bacterium B5-7]|nr:MAG: hypothetical protein DHS20C01_03210 [marine bacterium B5-7]
MSVMMDVVSGILLFSGAFFMLVGTIGILRFPDAMAQIHAAGITDTLGVALIVLGLMVQAGFTLLTIKLLVILAVLLFTNPTASHALSRSIAHYNARSAREGHNKELEFGVTNNVWPLIRESGDQSQGNTE